MLILFSLLNISSTNIIKLTPFLEYAQNDIHIINKKILPIENLNISLSTKTL